LGHSSCCCRWRLTRELEEEVGEKVVGVVVVSLGVSLPLEGEVSRLERLTMWSRVVRVAAPQ